MSQPPTTAETEQTALEAMLDALVAIVEAEIAELPITGRVIPFPTVL